MSTSAISKRSKSSAENESPPEGSFLMIRASWSWSVLAGSVALALLPSFASAQSTIAGIAKDSSGAVMAGVSVEASSEALIEKSRRREDGRRRALCGGRRPARILHGNVHHARVFPRKRTGRVVANITVTVDAILNPQFDG
jgi:hypothetical protein